MKKIFFLLCFFLVLTVSPFTKIKAATPSFDYQYIDQSPTQTLIPGQSTILWVKLKNTGSKAWDSSVVHLGSSNPKDRDSDFMPNVTNAPELSTKRTNWISSNRVIMEKPTAEVGETVGFGFYIKVPANKSTGTYREYFQPVIDGLDWMKDIGIYWEINVVNNNSYTQNQPLSYQYDLVSQTPSTSLVLAPSATTDVSIKIKNTGSATWLNSGANKIVLGWGSIYDNPDNPIDGFASGLETTTMQSKVAPGEIGEFKFQVKAPAINGNYKFYFTPMIQGIYPQPLKDIGIYWGVIVDKLIQPEITSFNVNNTEVTSGGIFVVSWSAKNATKCHVNRDDGNVKSGEYGPVGSTDFTVVSTNSYTLTCINENSKGETLSATKQFTVKLKSTTPTLPVPTNFHTVSTTNNTVSLTWNAVSGATKYELYRSAQSNSNYAVVYSGTNTSYTDTGLGSYSTYYYKILARKDNDMSLMSDPLTATLSSNNSIIPVAPSDLKAAGCLTQTICISWSSAVKFTNSGAVKAVDTLFKSTDANSGFNSIYSTTEGSFQDSNIVAGTTYYYKVRRAYPDAPGYSDYSPVVSAHILAANEYPAPIAQTPTVTSVTTTKINLSWGTPIGSYAYLELYYDVNIGGTFSNKLYAGLNTSYSHIGLNPGQKYYYKIKAIGGAGQYTESSILTASTLASPVTPTGLTATGKTSTSMQVSWNNAPNALGYELQRSTSLNGTYIVVYAAAFKINRVNRPV